MSQEVISPRRQNNTVIDPLHYNVSAAKCANCAYPIECIDVVRHFGFNPGNAIKYIWRAGEKDGELQEYKKARWYIDDQIRLLEGGQTPAITDGWGAADEPEDVIDGARLFADKILEEISRGQIDMNKNSENMSIDQRLRAFVKESLLDFVRDQSWAATCTS